MDVDGNFCSWHEVDQKVNSSVQVSGISEELVNETHSSSSSCFSPALHQKPCLQVSTAFSAIGSAPPFESARASRSQVEESVASQLEPEFFEQASKAVFQPKCTPSVSSSSPEKAAKKRRKDGPIVIEMFAGSGRLTAALKAANIRSAFGVDHKKLSAIAPIMVADLTTKAGQTLFMTWMDSPNLAGIFAAPPCGTCSLARNIKIRNSKGHLMTGPIPLRSPKFPEGFPNLKHTNLKRVLAANTLYNFLAKVALIAHERGLIMVIENPRSSLYWLTKFFQKIKHIFFFVAHQ